MYLHLGQDTVVREDGIVGIFDLEITSQSCRTREFLAKSEAAGRVETVGEDLPRSFLLWGDDKKWKVYLSQLSTATLARRSEERAWARV